MERNIKRLVVKGDSLLIIKQVKGVWECKSENLVGWWKQVKELMEKFEETHIQHIPRESNSEADLLANQSLEGVVVGAIKFQESKMEGTEDLQDIKQFLITGECPKHLDKVQRHRLVARAVSYHLIGEELYHKGKDLVLRKVPSKEEIN